MTTPPTTSDKIRELNDRFRRDGYGYGHIVVSPSLVSLGDDFGRRVAAVVRAFNEFTPENDPHGEHNFGAFILEGKEIIWEFSYFDRSLKNPSPDASDASVTARVLTIMLASDYC